MVLAILLNTVYLKGRLSTMGGMLGTMVLNLNRKLNRLNFLLCYVGSSGPRLHCITATAEQPREAQL